MSSRANKKAAEEEEKLLKLFQTVNKSQQDGFTQWCEQSLHTLNTANNLDGERTPQGGLPVEMRPNSGHFGGEL